MKGQLKAVPLRLECKGYGGNLEPSGEGEACHRPPSSDGRGLKKAVTLREEGQPGLGAIPPSGPVALKAEKSNTRCFS